MAEVKRKCDEKNADAEIEDIERLVERGVEDILKKSDDQDHQDHLGQPVF